MKNIDQELINAACKQAQRWKREITDDSVQAEISKIINDLDSTDVKKQESAVDAFYKDIDFGTGGIRGIMGVGSNRINNYTLVKATRGLIAFAKEKFFTEFTAGDLRFAIAYDTRNNSKSFAEQVALLLAKEGIHVYSFSHATPTPVLSFTVRKYACQIGIVITASHNPKEYNGYKVYFSDGGQVVPPHDKAIVAKVNEVTELDYHSTPIAEAVEADSGVRARVMYVDEEVSSEYQNEAKAFVEKLLPDYASKVALDLPVVFTSLHGTGGSYIVPGLQQLGFNAVSIVAEQSKPDGNFPTVIYPNPEEYEALDLGLKKMQDIGAHVLIGTDPDADRIGVAIRDQEAKMFVLNGNQIGLLLADFVLMLYRESGMKHRDPFLVRTIVTTPFIDEIAKDNGVEVMTVLTGFKYIGECITKYEMHRDYVFGLEESHGYLANTNVRDKDAVTSAYLIILMAAYYRARGSSVYERLTDIYIKYGYGLEKLVSFTKAGPNGQREIVELIGEYEKTYGNYQNGKPVNICGEQLLYFRDYDKQFELNLATGEKKPFDLPRSKVIQLETDAKSIITVRPSGTEPKIKYYFSVRSNIDPTDKMKEDKYAVIKKKHTLANSKIADFEKLLVKK